MAGVHSAGVWMSASCSYVIWTLCPDIKEMVFTVMANAASDCNMFCSVSSKRKYSILFHGVTALFFIFAQGQSGAGRISFPIFTAKQEKFIWEHVRTEQISFMSLRQDGKDFNQTMTWVVTKEYWSITKDVVKTQIFIQCITQGRSLKLTYIFFYS